MNRTEEPTAAGREKANRGNLVSNIRFLEMAGLDFSGKKILEIGSGKGNMVRHLMGLGADVTGTEVNPEYIEYAKDELGVVLLPMRGDRLDFPDETFDYVVSFDVFEHIPDTDRHFDEVRRVLKAGGSYLFGTPNKLTNVPFEVVKERSLTKYRQYHCSLFTCWGLKKKLEERGFSAKFMPVNVVTPYFREKVRRYLGAIGSLALKVVNPDALPLSLRTNFYVVAEKEDNLADVLGGGLIAEDSRPRSTGANGRPTRICFISLKAYQCFNSSVKRVFGGAEVQISLLSKEVAKRKTLDVYCVVADYGQPDGEVFDGVIIRKSLNFSDSRLGQIVSFFRTFVAVNADVYVLRSLSHPAGIIALFCRLWGRSLVYMVAHDSETDRSHEVYKRLAGKSLAFLNFALADKVIVQNSYQHERITHRFGKKCFILNSSYEISPLPERRLKENVLWVGRSESWKRPEVFLELAKLNPQDKFVMVCPPSTNNGWLSGALEKEAKSIGNLEFHSFVPLIEIDEFFKKAKIYVSTSEQEGFQNTMIQAAKNGVPILSLNVNPNEFITVHECGFVCGDNLDMMKEKLRLLLGDEALCRRLGGNAYEYAKENHDITVNANRFLKIIGL